MRDLLLHSLLEVFIHAPFVGLEHFVRYGLPVVGTAALLRWVLEG